MLYQLLLDNVLFDTPLIVLDGKISLQKLVYLHSKEDLDLSIKVGAVN